VNNFIDFILEDSIENIELMNQELASIGLNPDKLKNSIIEMTEKKSRELKIEKGKQLKELYQKIKQKIQNTSTQINEQEIELKYALAFRNMSEELNQQEIKNILHDDLLLEELTREIKKYKCLE
jgi:hypothetical protein